MKLGKLLCPVDFSPQSRGAFLAATDLAREQGAVLTLAHVVETVPAVVSEPLLDVEFRSRLISEADGLLTKWRNDARALGVRQVEVRRLDGSPWEAIVALVREGGHDLVVLSTHGRTGLMHVLLGSVAEKVVRNAPCSVLVVRSTAMG